MNADEMRQTALSLAEEYRGRLISALEMLTGEKVDVELQAGEPQPRVADEDLVWRRFDIDLPTPSALWVAMGVDAEKTLGKRVLTAAGVDDFEPADLSASSGEVLQTSVAAVAQLLGRNLGVDVAVSLGEIVAQNPPPAFYVRMRLGFPDCAVEPLILAVPDALVNGLLQANAPTDSSEAVTPKVSSVSGTAAENAGSLYQPDVPVLSSGFDRILDFELPLRVSFGRATIPLREVLKLTTGSIVELDRTIADPVEIIVNDRVIGRGEVVVVDGNYGVRIQEVVGASKSG